jgi:hypothetical protein
MTAPILPSFQIHWSAVLSGDAETLTSPDCRLLAVWPAPVNHDVCFKEAGFTLFGDNDDAWDEAAEDLLRRVLDSLSRFGAVKYLSEPLRDNPPWYLRPFRAAQKLPLQQQALLPMHWDSLPSFHAQFGNSGAALRTGSGHFLLWINLPNAGPDASEFVKSIAGPWPVVETELRWAILLPVDTR